MARISPAGKDIFRSKPPAPRKIYGVLVVLAAFALSLIAYMAYGGLRIGATHAPLVNAAMDIELEATTAHLKFEEIMSGDRPEDIRQVWEHVDAADRYAQAMLEGGESKEGFIVPMDDPELREEVREAKTKIAEFRRITSERFDARSTSGTGSEIDQRYHAVFEALINQADTVKSVLQGKIKSQLRGFKKAQYTLIGIIFGLFAAAALMVRKYERAKAEAFSIVKSMHLAAEEQLALFEKFVENSKEGMGWADIEGNVRYMNPALCRMVGRANPADAIGKPVLEYYSQENQSRLQNEIFPAVLRDGSWTGELDLISIKGTSLTTAHSLFALYNEEGEPVCFANVLSDLTEQKRIEHELRKHRDRLEELVAESTAELKKANEELQQKIAEQKTAEMALQESEARYRNVYNTAPIAFVLWDRDCLVTDWNKSAEMIFGWTKDEVVGQNFFEFLIPDVARFQVEAVVEALLQGEIESHSINENLTKDGDVILCEWNNSIRYNENGRIMGAISLGLDITERVRAEEEIRKLNEELEQRVAKRTAELAAANKELETFAYSVSHDLRTPLRGMDGFSKILLEDYSEKLDERGKDYLGRVRAASQRMGSLIDDLLSLSRVSRATLHRMNVDLSALAESVASDLRRDGSDRQVNLKILSGLTAQGDPQLLGLVLENLFGNAWKFTGNCEDAQIEFGMLAPTEAEAAGHAEKDVYFVRDNGAGFDMAYAGKLFGAFQRLHSESEFPGTGVGLATVQRIINRHGGRIWAEGEVGKGATFYFVLK